MASLLSRNLGVRVRRRLRLGQHAAASGNDRTQLVLAQLVYALAPDIDPAYLLRRVNDELGMNVSDAGLRNMLAP